MCCSGGDTEVRCWRVNLDGVDPVATQVAEFRNPAPFHTKGVMQLSETNGVAWDSMVRVNPCGMLVVCRFDCITHVTVWIVVHCCW